MAVGRRDMITSSALEQWEREQEGGWRKALRLLWIGAGMPLWGLLFGALAFSLGVYTASSGEGTGADPYLARKIREAEVEQSVRNGELGNARMVLIRGRSVD